MVAPEHDAHLKALEAALGPGVVFHDGMTRSLFSTDASRMPGACFAVIRPRDESQVLELLRVAQEREISLVPRGAGTSNTGSAHSLAHQIVLDMSLFSQIRDISPVDQVAVVEPGVLTGQLQAAAWAKGLFYPPDPASARFSTIGGNVATCAGGLRAVKYGVTRDYVLGLRAGLLGGGLLRVGGRFLKTSAGYDLVRLMVGSEGTLAVFTEIVLRLLPRPASASTHLASFPDEKSALAAADAILVAGILPRAIEYMDRDVVRLLEAQPGPKMASGARLLVEIDGAQTQVDEERHIVDRVLLQAGATSCLAANDEEGREGLWAGRRSISQTVSQSYKAKSSQDLGVPRSQLADCVASIKAAGVAHGIRVLTYGHAGDANLHFNFVYDPDDPAQVTGHQAAVADALMIVREAYGTMTGEHGIGAKKRRVFTESLDPTSLAMMRGIKELFDPKNLLNPGKILAPVESLRGESL